MYIYIYLFTYIRYTFPPRAFASLTHQDLNTGILWKKIAGSADDSFIYMFIQVSSRGTPAGWKFLKKKTRETQRRSRRKVNSVDF